MSEENTQSSAAPAVESPATDAPASDQSQTDTSPEALQAQAESGSPAEKAQAKKMLKKLELKIDGETFEEELPFEVDEAHAEYLKKNLQLSKKAQKSMQSEKEYRAQVDQFVKSMKGDTRKTLESMGIDVKALAAQLIEEEMQNAAMTPEQRERAELQAKLKAMEEERRKEREERDKSETERLTQQEYERIDTKMTAAISSAGIPKSPYVVKKIAQYMVDGLSHGVNLEPEDVIGLVKEEVQNDIQELIKALGEDQVESFIGKDIFDKVRKRNVAKAKQTPASAKAAIKDVGAKKSTDSTPKEKVNMRDFFKI